jgi:hypothetical protein
VAEPCFQPRDVGEELECLWRRPAQQVGPTQALVYDVQKALRADFVECLRRLTPDRLASLDDGLRLVLDL